jgi:DHA2 family methylenomycin A resistance protein-like MFS transporter
VAALELNFVVFINYSIWVALPLYTERRFHVSPETNANLLLVITIMHLAAAFPAGRAIRRFGALPTLATGLLLAVTGTVLVLPMPAPGWLPLPLMLYGSGMVAAVNAAGDVVLHLGGGSSRAVGVVRLSSDLGLVIGPWVAGTLADAFGYNAPFLALPSLMLIALLLLVWRGRALFSPGAEPAS